MQNDPMICGAKRSQYNFLIDSFNHKSLSQTEFPEIIKFIKKNDVDVFDGFAEYANESYWEHGDTLVIIICCKWKPMNMAIRMANKIRDKFFCDVTLTMTDDDGCNQYYFLKGSQGIKLRKNCDMSKM